ncbi:MAG: hypothetical protein R2849_14355 [Thermomicrobiales bacterium]
MQRTLVIITDGEPTAYRTRSGEVRYSEPPSEEALAMTYAEARRLRRDQILLIVALLSQERQTVTSPSSWRKRPEGSWSLPSPTVSTWRC